jgi:hypothetical protein
MADILTIFSEPSTWAALATLVVMEIVLGIDNLIFISILSNKLPAAQRQRVRRIGIGLALGLRLILLSTIAWVVSLTTMSPRPISISPWPSRRGLRCSTSGRAEGRRRAEPRRSCIHDS